MTKPDIQSRADIVIIVDTFYQEVREDDVLQGFFTNVQWEKHLPIMYDFWENVVFYTGSYQGNPMEKHRAALEKFPIHEAHFAHWVFLFTKVVNNLYKGKKAKSIIDRANSIAKIMEIKLLQNNNPQITLP